jgi:hypothetical protein
MIPTNRIEIYFWHGDLRVDDTLVQEIQRSNLRELDMIINDANDRVSGFSYRGHVADFVDRLPHLPMMKLSEPNIIYTTMHRSFSQR